MTRKAPPPVQAEYFPPGQRPPADPLLFAGVCRRCRSEGPFVAGDQGEPRCYRCWGQVEPTQPQGQAPPYNDAGAVREAARLGDARAAELAVELAARGLEALTGFRLTPALKGAITGLASSRARRPATKPVKAVMAPRKSAGGSRRSRSPGKGGA